ncbi:MAG TPA: hypothetical protein VFU86_11125 [Terriglobales bacterium]|nr:hypothetical protein [Terriglobales bacterium]
MQFFPVFHQEALTRILHDARRSSARNKSAAGVATRVIMQMQGWTTEAMFRRYAIVDQNDLRRALIMEEAQRAENQQKAQQLQNSYNPTQADA